jgi:hypothetical protein
MFATFYIDYSIGYLDEVFKTYFHEAGLGVEIESSVEVEVVFCRTGVESIPIETCV